MNNSIPPPPKGSATWLDFVLASSSNYNTNIPTIVIDGFAPISVVEFARAELAALRNDLANTVDELTAAEKERDEARKKAAERLCKHANVVPRNNEEARLLYAWVKAKAERVRQDMKWGEQSHQSMEWFAILSEEVGELAQAVNEQRWRARPDTLHELRLELVQVAAVAAAWLECLDRNAWQKPSDAAKAPNKEETKQ